MSVVDPPPELTPTVVALPHERSAADMAQRYVALHRDLPTEFVAPARQLVSDLLMIAARGREPFLTLYLRTDPPRVGVHANEAIDHDGGPGAPIWFTL